VNDETSPSESPAENAELPERQSTPFLVLQFFIFPMAIVAVCVTVFVIFGLISQDKHTPREYLAEARAGGGMFNIRRWQAAYALANILESPKELAAARQDPKFAEEVLDLYRTSQKGEGDDVLLRRYLTLALGRLADARATTELRTAALQEGGDPQTRIYAIWALGAIADPAVVPELVALSTHEDAGLRKAAVHALGGFPGEPAGQALRESLKDGTEDVRWNAALALGRRGDVAAAPELQKMLDRAHLEALAAAPEVPPEKRMTPEQLEDVLLEAVKWAAIVPDPALGATLERLRDTDPSLKVREAARRALSTRK
jgi:hypothetical protein